jgi:hypothetical protein
VGSSSSFLVVLDLASILLSHRSWLSLVECLCRSFRLPLEFSSLRKAFCLIRFLSCRSRFQYSSSVPDLIYLFLASSRHAFFSCSPDPVSVQKIFLRLLFFARTSVSMSRFRSSYHPCLRISARLPSSRTAGKLHCFCWKDFAFIFGWCCCFVLRARICAQGLVA